MKKIDRIPRVTNVEVRPPHGLRVTFDDGLTRDVDQIVQMAYPAFCAGISPLDSAGRQEVVEFGRSVLCGGVAVRPGDLVVGDVMGVVVVPAEIAAEVAAGAEEKDRGETTAREELARGEDVVEVFCRHGIL